METSCISDSMSNRFFLAFFIAVLAGCGLIESDQVHSAPNEIPPSIAFKLAAQEDAWNQGDIKAFMHLAYWQSDSLIFIGSKGPTYGFESTLTNYLQSYPDPDAMGELSFDLLDWRPLGRENGLLIGGWRLHRLDSLGDLSGHFSLVWEERGEGWVIIADHSS